MSSSDLGISTYTVILKFFWVEAEIVLAEGAHAHEFHVAFQPVVEHGQLVNPVFAEDATQCGHARVVFEFAAALQTIMLVDVRLQVL